MEAFLQISFSFDSLLNECMYSTQFTPWGMRDLVKGKVSDSLLMKKWFGGSVIYN